jgi:Transcriptional regulator
MASALRTREALIGALKAVQCVVEAGQHTDEAGRNVVDKTERKLSGKAEPNGGVESVDRALRILGCFLNDDETLNLTELAARTGYYKSTILRLTASLERAGFLIRHSDKSYALGSELMRLGAIYQRAFRLEAYVRPVLRSLLEGTGESASFFRREGDRRICLFREDSTHGIREHIREGDALSLTAGAAGHVLTRFDPTNPDSLPSPELFDSLPLISYGERDPEVAAAAVPVFSRREGLVGALTVSGPLSRFTPEKIARIKEQLLRAGRELSTMLGGSYR